jgi:predicted outer membrane repeat protein
MMESLPNKSENQAQSANGLVLSDTESGIFSTDLDASKSHKIVFIDTSVTNYQNLIAGIKPGTEVVILDPEQDGVAQITDYLRKNKYSSVHIVSHGSDGSLQLGGTWLNAENLDTYANALQEWRSGLTEDGDILLYGCDVAQDDYGKAFVQKLSQLTGADIAASDDLTGSAQLGGDWALEFATGLVDAPLAFQLGAMEAYNGVLSANIGDVIINEFSQGSDGGKEWVEILVVKDNLNLQGVRLTDDPATTGDKLDITLSGAGFNSLRAGTLIVLYNGGDVDGTITPDLTYNPSVGDYTLQISSRNTSGTYAVTRNNIAAWNSVTGAITNASNTDTPRLINASGTEIYRFPRTTPAGATTVPLVPVNRAAAYLGNSAAGATNAANWSADFPSPGANPGLPNGGDNTAWINSLRGNNVNTAPAVNTAGNPTLTAINEDDTNNRGMSVADLVRGLITDSNSSSQSQGIAVTGLTGSSNGTWQYSLNGGTTWTNFGAVSDTSATVLSSATPIYVGSLGGTPNSQGWLTFGASPSFGRQTVSAGETTVFTGLTAGVNNSLGAVGYTNYNSGIPVPFNPAFPVLDRNQGFTLSFDLRINSETNSSDDNSDNINDRAGFSVIVVTSDNTKAIELGFWENEIWAQRDGSDVRPVPNPTRTLFTHSPTERAFRDTRTAVTRYDLRIKGDNYELFAAGGTTPILTGSLKNYTAFDHTNAGPGGTSLPYDPYERPNFIFLGDNTSSAQSNFTLGRVELQQETRVRFVPNPNSNGTADISFRAWDGTNSIASGTTGVNTTSNGGTTAYSTASETATLTINPINDAPSFTGNATLAAVLEDNTNPAGNTIASLFGSLFNDIDAGSSLSGVAVIGNTANSATQGVWQYSTDGSNWFAIGSVNDGTNALALSRDTRVRFLPAANYNGTPDALTVRALDNTYSSFTVDNSSVIRINTSAANIGGITAIAASSNTITTNITPDNDNPVVTLPGAASVVYAENTENSASVLIDGSATVTDVDSANFDAGTLTVRFSSGGAAEDRLGIRNQGTGATQINLDGRTIKYGATEIGNFAGGVGTESLVVSLNANATPIAVQALLQNITYANASQNPNNTSRTVEFVVTDGDGGSSTVVSKSITITPQNDASLVGQNIVLYDGTTGKLPTEAGAAPGAPWFEYQDSSFLTPPGVTSQSATGGGTQLATDNVGYAGYFNYGVPLALPLQFASTPVNPAFPTLDRNLGYTLNFNAQLVAGSSTNALGADVNQNGVSDRAGFNVILLSSDKKGIQLGFFENRIWAYEDGTNQVDPSLEPDKPAQNNFRTFFTQAEGVSFSTIAPVNYGLTVFGNTYTLFANNNTILTGRLRDYSAFRPLPYNTAFGTINPPDPYEQRNFVFLGDNSVQAGATVNLSQIGITTNKNFENLTIDEDQSTAAIPFTITDFENPTGPFTINPTSTNTTIIPNGNIVIGGTGANRTVTVTPAPNQNGIATITLDVNDGNLTTTRNFNVTVNPVNDAPTFTKGLNQTTTAGAGLQTVLNWATGFNPGPVDEAGQLLDSYIVTVTDNPGIFLTAPTIDKVTGNLVYTPVDIINGSTTATVEVRVKDNGGTARNGVDTSAPQTFTITINPEVVSIQATDATANEPGSSADNTGVYRISRTGTRGDFTVNLAVDASSTASSGDYILNRGLTVVIPNGSSFVDVTLTTVDDIPAEAAETLQLNLATGNGYTINPANNNGIVTIAANDFVVTNTNDSGEGSLRQAILNANAAAGANIVTFAGTVFTDGTPDTITLTSGQLLVTDALTIQGTGANQLTITGNSVFRVINASSPLTVNGVAITGGNAANGGGISSSSILTLNNTTVFGNRASGGGGGIFTDSVVLNNTTVSGNTAGGDGGAINATTIDLSNTTISGNKANGDGGGIISGGGNIRNSTIAFNTADDDGNGSGDGGGISNSGTLAISNSIIAANTDKGNQTPDVAGSGINGNAYNVIGSTPNITPGTIGTGTDIINPNPGLAPLANNGGTTQTHALQVGSPAINAGIPNYSGGLTTDQRGGSFNRVQGDRIDIGAFESNFVPPKVNFGAPTYNTTEGSSATQITVEVTLDGSPATNVSVPIFINGSSTATQTADYTFSPAIVTFAAGVTGADLTQNITFTINPDDLPENLETVVLNFGTLTGAVAGTLTASTLNIAANDSIEYAVLAGNATLNEGNSGTQALTFTVTRSGGIGVASTVNYGISGTATNNVDYNNIQVTGGGTALTGALNFAAGEVTKTITVDVLGDTQFEPDENITLTLSSPNLTAAPANSRITTGTATTNIVNDDSQPIISVDDVAVNEGGTATFTISLSNSSSQAITVNYNTSDGTATTADSDYTAVNSTAVTFNAGETTKTFTVSTTNDNKFEADETVNINLTGATNATVAADDTGVGVLTITNNDALPTITINDVPAVEGNTATFTISLSNPSSQVVTVNYSTSDGTATTADSDYTAVSSTPITFNPGETSKIITVSTTADTKFEVDETLTINLSGATNATIAADNTGVGVLTITNNDVRPTISIDSVSVDEGDSATFTVSLSNASSEIVTLNYNTSDGTATTADSDYTAINSTTTSTPITFNAGETTKTITVNTTGDTKFEADETLSINLSGATNGTIASGAAGVGGLTIRNNDNQPTISIDDVGVDEGGSATFTISLSNPSSQTVTVNYSTSNGTATTADNDYTAITSTPITFNAGETSKTITVNSTTDTKFEADETVNINLSGATNATIVAGDAGIGVLTIRNDDAAPTISIDDVTVTEGGTATFTLSLSNPSSQAVTLKYSSSDATATTADNDYTAINSTDVTFNPGETSKTFTLATTTDTKFETNETLSINLSDVVGATIAAGNAGIGELTITNDDTRPTIRISDASADEGDAATFTITLSNPSSEVVSVNYNTSDGTGTTADSDYTEISSTTISFNPGETSKTFTVNTTADTKFETNETLSVNLSTPTNGTLIAGAARVGELTIRNNDAQPVISIDDVAVDEGETATFTISLSNPSSETVTVSYSTSDGTARTADSDYTAVPSTLITFNPGETSKTFTVNTTPDNKLERGETVNVTLNGATNATIATANSGVGVLTIRNDDALPTLTIDDVAVNEGGTATFTIRLSNPSIEDVTFNYSTSDGTATTADSDYTAITSTPITIREGQLSTTITVNTTTDTKFELDETLSINLSDVVGAKLPTDDTGIGVLTITNNDTRPTISIDDVSVDEGSAATFTVSLSNTSSEIVTVNYNTTDGTATAADSDYTAISLTTITFNPGEISKTFTVESTVDNKFEAAETLSINLSNATNGTIVTGAAGVGELTIRNEDPVPTVSISPVSISQREGSAGVTPYTFTVNLSNPSDRIITVDYTTSDGTATVANSDYVDNDGRLTFNPGIQSQIITVSVNGDGKAEDDETFAVSLNSTSNANLASNRTVTGAIVNDDVPGISIEYIAGLSTKEEGRGTAIFTVKLISQPSADVTLGLTSNNTLEGTLSNSSLTFTSGNWNVEQIVTITGVDDDFDDGDVAYKIITAPAISADSDYNNRETPDIDVINIDNETAGFSIVPISDASTTETGGTTSFKVKLNSRPTADVTLNLASDNPTEGFVSTGNSLTFNSTNWNVEQTVTLTGVDEEIDDGNIIYKLIASSLSSDTSYSNKRADTNVTNINNDTAGFTITPLSGATTGLTTTEAGGTASFSVKLNSKPTDNVTLNLASDNSREGVVSTGSSLTFDSTNWNREQIVTITGVDDTLVDGDIGYKILTSAATSRDLRYNGFDPEDISVTNTNDDVITIEFNIINGTDVSETIGGTPGNDRIFAFGGNDTILAGFGIDEIFGGDGNDRLFGGEGDDRLFGETGNDQMWGDGGEDFLYGGVGNDICTGGFGRDTFVVTRSEGTDRITDFQIGEDAIACGGGLRFDSLLITQNGNNTLLIDTSTNQNLAVLIGVNASSLTANSFRTI